MNDSDLLRSAVRLKGSVELVVYGSSMLPSLVSGDKVFLVPFQKIEVGDLIAYPGKRSAKPVVHRVVNYDINTITVVGDNSDISTVVSQKAIIGKVDSVLLKDTDGWCRILPRKPIASLIAHTSCYLIRKLKEGNMLARPRLFNAQMKLLRKGFCNRWRHSIKK